MRFFQLLAFAMLTFVLGAAVLLALIVGVGRAIYEAVRGGRGPASDVGSAPVSAG